jgi:hypothetical protein
MTHSIYSPLVVGQIIYPSEQAQDFVWSYVQHSSNENLAKGLLCEHAHNEAFNECQWLYGTTETSGPYDRVFYGLMQDDKLATIQSDGQLSNNHTISAGEFETWSKSSDDVIIHSFEEVGDNISSRYCGAISFLCLLQEKLLIPSKFNDGRFFNRHVALKRSGLMLE